MGPQSGAGRHALLRKPLPKFSCALGMGAWLCHRATSRGLAAYAGLVPAALTTHWRMIPDFSEWGSVRKAPECRAPIAMPEPHPPVTTYPTAARAFDIAVCGSLGIWRIRARRRQSLSESLQSVCRTGKTATRNGFLPPRGRKHTWRSLNRHGARTEVLG